MDPDNELLRCLNSVARNEVDPAELWQWLTNNIWRLLSSSNAFDRDAVMELDLAVGAIDEGQMNYSQLHEIAKSIIEQVSPVRDVFIAFNLQQPRWILRSDVTVQTGTAGSLEPVLVR